MAFLILEQINTLQQKLREWITNLIPRKKEDGHLFYALEENAGCVHLIQGETRVKEFVKSMLSDSIRVFKEFPGRRIVRKIPPGNLRWGIMLPNGKYSHVITHGDIQQSLHLEAYLGENATVYFLRKDGVLENKEIQKFIPDPSRIHDNRLRVINNLGNRIVVEAVLKELGFVDEDFRKNLIPKLETALKNIQKELSPAIM